MTTKTTRLTLLSTAATVLMAFAAPAFAADRAGTIAAASPQAAESSVAQADYTYHHHHYHHRRHEHGHWVYY